MQKFSECNETNLLEGIKHGKYFGYVVCDLSTPSDIIENIKHILFPPVIQRMDIDESLLSPYMQNVTSAANTSLPRNDVVLQTYHGKQQLLFTPLVRFYLDLGMVVSNISLFIQYHPAKSLLPFTEKVYNLRVAATHEGDDAKSNTSKLVGNR